VLITAAHVLENIDGEIVTLKLLAASRRLSPSTINRVSYPGIELHCKHPSGPSIPFKGRESA
jgi:hypothetical protein